MQNKGWIKLHRAIADTEFWLSEPFTRSQAWIDLLLLANHKAGHIRKRGILITVERGQVGHSEEALGKRWKWSKGKVRRFLAELIRLSRITRSISEKTELKNTSVSSLICIINYDKYQGDNTEDDTEDGPKTVPEQECKEKNILSDSTESDHLPKGKSIKSLFDYWNSLSIIQHRKIDKFERHLAATLKAYSPEEIGEAMKNYKDILESPDHFFKYRWGLDEFLSRKGGLEKFLAVNNPFDNFRKGEK
ncbi:MAG: hypothetical protein A4E58_02113 [Syntrophorhabdus sp. PtaB.Bin006]|nr:MAG: hypothetical protein A4E58_02113 [Syntrophorhabdus sp. PtaB.Bin006]OPY77796.1 MAG: hypothetical protein A4E65_02590 [Syntrophorhabdus sp. PtaU1.Bin153]